MATYLVTYDLNKETKRPPIVDRIREFPGFAMLSESSYAITTPLSPKAVYNALQPLLDGNDTLYVITLSKPYWGQGTEEVNNWLENNL